MKRLMILMIFGMTQPVAADDHLHISDGQFLRDAKMCSSLQKGEMDSPDFEVSNSGRSIGLPEAGCQVATSTEIRRNRYSVVSDCSEAGDNYSYNFMLDIISESKLRINGVDHYRCDAARPMSANASSPAFSKNVTGLIAAWVKETMSCRGSNEDPTTNKACDRRSDISKKLDDAGMCYGKESDTSAAAYEWHVCGPNSIRYN